MAQEPSESSDGKMLLIIDNYDSFTYNLVQAFGELEVAPVVYRNDKISIAGIRKLGPERIVISPGPGRPEGAGISVEVITEFLDRVPILGVCLGHQCLGYALGGKITQAPQVMHGKTSMVSHDGRGLFGGIDSPFSAMRYHSLVIDPGTVPGELLVTARTDDGVIMGVRHRQYPSAGVQFHPESFLTPSGKTMLKNFLNFHSQ